MYEEKQDKTPTHKSAQFTRGDKHVKDYIEHRMRLISLMVAPKARRIPSS